MNTKPVSVFIWAPDSRFNTGGNNVDPSLHLTRSMLSSRWRTRTFNNRLHQCALSVSTAWLILEEIIAPSCPQELTKKNQTPFQRLLCSPFLSPSDSSSTKPLKPTAALPHDELCHGGRGGAAHEGLTLVLKAQLYRAHGAGQMKTFWTENKNLTYEHYCYFSLLTGGHARVNIVRARFRKAVTKMAAAAGSGKPTSPTVQTLSFSLNLLKMYNFPHAVLTA